MKRIVLVDYMHLAHRCSQAQPLSTSLMIDGELKTIDTTIPNYTIKNVFQYSNKGRFHIGVFVFGVDIYVFKLQIFALKNIN